MAAPTHTALGTPAGIMLKDGFSSICVFNRRPNIAFKIISVKPPALDGGDPIDQTTMHNTAVMTRRPQSLYDMKEMTGTCAYDPDGMYNESRTYLLNQEGSATLWFPDGSYLDMYAYLQKLEPGELKKGDRPEAGFTFAITNFDPVNHVEAVPVLTSASGT